MKITKVGHCCLVLEMNGAKFVTDPGSFTTAQNTLINVDAILITHEHGDHFHMESIKEMLRYNPDATIVTNSAVGKLLADEGLKHTRVGDGEQTDIKNIKIEGFGKDHAPIYETMGLVENTGFMIDERFYFPGDNFHDPKKQVEILALPVAGPWMKLSHAVDFAKVITPKVAFGVHDAMIIPPFRGFVGNALRMFVPDMEYVALEDGESREF